MRVAARTIIGATPPQVWDYISAPANGPHWQEAAVWTRLTSDGPVGLGSTMDHLGTWLRMRVPTTAVVTVFEPPIRFGYDITSTLSRTPSLMRYELEPVPGGTRLTLSNEAQLPRWLTPFEPLLARNVQGMFERDVRRLKAAIESMSSSTMPGSPAAQPGSAAPPSP
ncbi:MAG TPA: SRPBCC family protein [Candidatus Limnocylindrales bacterium]|nr:SRPBCC family protein [Candidatus Limnocylindrales bacterium]